MSFEPMDSTPPASAGQNCIVAGTPRFPQPRQTERVRFSNDPEKHRVAYPDLRDSTGIFLDGESEAAPLRHSVLQTPDPVTLAMQGLQCLKGEETVGPAAIDHNHRIGRPCGGFMS